MSSFNKVIIMGNLTRDIEVRATASGLSIGKFDIAINRKYKGSDGKPAEAVTFVPVTVFGKQAETIAKFTKKGSPLHIEGRLHLEQWKDKASGKSRSKLAVILETFQFVGSAAQKASNAASSANPQPQGIDEDVPF